MPTLNFILPHWMYWGGLLLFPAVAMYLVAHQRRHGTPREPILFNAYLFWLTAGFAGIHRFYLKSWWGLAFVPLFVAVVYCNSQVREVRDDVSRTFAAMEQGQVAVAQAKPIDAANPTPEERKALQEAEADLKKQHAEYEVAAAVSDRWESWARGFAIALALMLLVDAFLMPGIVRRMHARGDAGVAVAVTQPHMPPPPQVHEQGTAEDPTMGMHSRFTDAVEWVNVKAGE